MLNFIFFLVISINVSSIYYYRNYSNQDEKTAFFSGIFTLSVLPIVVKGLFLSATNIQNIWGDLSGYFWAYFIVFFTTLYSAIYVYKVLLAKISNKFFNKSS